MQVYMEVQPAMTQKKVDELTKQAELQQQQQFDSLPEVPTAS